MKSTHIAILALASSLALPAILKAGEPLKPVNSIMMDTGDDPERTYSAAPTLDWSYFGDRMRYVTRGSAGMVHMRHDTDVDLKFAFLQIDAEKDTIKFEDDGKSDIGEILAWDNGTFPALCFAGLPKIGVKSRVVNMDAVNRFLAEHPNVTWGGGRIGEYDGLFLHFYDNNSMFKVRPTGPYGSDFQNAWFDVMNSYMRRGGTPFLAFNFNQPTQMQYTARERMLSLGMSQLFYRGGSQPITKLVTLRSAARQYVFPYAFQWSGSAGPRILNEDDVLAKKAEPIFDCAHLLSDEGNYMKSLALCRQMYYLCWLNGARYFSFEGGSLFQHKYVIGGIDKLIGSVGTVGPVQTPVAIISEYSHPWAPPRINRFKKVELNISDHTPYRLGDYQTHGVYGFYMPHYLQCELLCEDQRGEDHAIPDSPYGECFDFLLSDVRDQSLARYGLLVWSGVPPRVPSMMRDKLRRYIDTYQGRVILFGDAARSMFGEWFEQQPPETIPAGATVAYNNQTFTETSAFQLYRLRNGGSGIPQMKTLGTVNGKALVVECMGGLILVLSDYGLNKDQACDPATFTWEYGDVISDVPHNLLKHARAILDHETSNQIPFDVGSDSLHYVVTRPRPGEYLLGLVNDRMTSQSFAIHSHIGPISRLVEVPLNDNKDLMKTVCNGVAYAPTGMRRQVNEKPFDYGLSDTSHIEGRDFRLFRISVREQGVREVPRITYPARPTGRVLALPEIGHVRHKLQNIASFFTWFDGVKVDATALLNEEDLWLNEQALYVDRRGVRIVVDGTAVDDHDLERVLAKMAIFQSAPKNLIVKQATPALASAAQKAGVALTLPADVNRLSLPEHRFDDRATLNIVELYYASDDDLYQDVKRFDTGEGDGELKGKRAAVDLYPKPQADEADYYYVGPYIYDLGALVHRYPAEFNKLAGVRVDSWYLRDKTTEALLAETRAFIGTGKRLAVDMRREQCFFDGITLDPKRDNYEEGIRRFNEVCAKMGRIGATDIILHVDQVSDRIKLDKKDKKRLKNGKDVEEKTGPTPLEQRDTLLKRFIETAERNDIRIHLVFEDPKKIRFSNMIDKHDPRLFSINGNGALKASPIKITDILVEGDEDRDKTEHQEHRAGSD
ncbi:MAG: hypothetical protein GC159_12185 [Phycisphaera sp.]|nr:hypothetical protein [Phycisphaera sp.]